MILNAMEQGPAHELFDAETVVAAFEQFLNPIRRMRSSMRSRCRA
jgi:hypothetical protein